ncbi:MAG: PD-(D/E)XK nuclease family protein [Candidatus Hydrogenedentes bacterium]|nr:PD-(D/E)XK nuclease family protein [Candidatus Hydrogenedentota bacterium]
MARVFVFAGGARSPRDREIDTLAVEHWGRSILVVPTRHEANERAARIIQSHALPGGWGASVVSFEDFVLALLREAGIYPHEMDEVERRMLVSSVLDRLHANGALNELGDAARSPGFANHVLRAIAKLKQAAIDPATFRQFVAARSRTSWIDPIVASIYEAYQSTLHQSDAYDRVGVYWRAHVLLCEGKPSLFDRADCVLFDGFDDFTPSEFRVIERVASYVDVLAIGLVCSSEATSQSDLYAIPLATLNIVKKAFPEADVRSLSEPVPRTRVEYVTTHLFWRDQPQPPRGIAEDLLLHPCHDRMHECEWIGREIKSIIVEQNVAPATIAVLFRRVEDVAPRLRLVFNEFGIPATFHAPLTLLDTTLARFLLQLLEVSPEWEREAVLDVITSRWSCVDDGHAGAFGYLARMAGVIDGKTEWMSCLARFQAWLSDGAGETHDAILRRVPDAMAAVRALSDQRIALERRLQDFPAEASRTRYCDAMLKCIAALRPERALETFEPEVRRLEESALHAATAVLRRMRRWGHALDNDTMLTLSQFRTELRDAFAASALEQERTISGVQVMSADSARYRAYDYLFLGGMNEGEFPAPPAADAIYSDEDWSEFARAGARVEMRSRQMEREMLLFHHVLGRARSRVYLSWSLSGHDGRPLAQSPFIEDVKGLVDPVATPSAQSTSFLPAFETAASAHDLRNVPHASREVEVALPDVFGCMAAGLEVESQRNSRAAFDPYDAILTDSALLDQLLQIYGQDHVFSAAQLEAYAECPFQFYLQRILRVEPVEAPDEEFDPRTRGRILHEALQVFHESYRGVPVSAIPVKQGRDTMVRICNEVFDRHVKGEVTAPRGVVRTERARMESQLLRYFDFAREEEVAWKPSNFEVGFGRAHALSADPLSRPEPFALDTNIGDVLLAGRIDRIDVMESRARIVDYKTRLNYEAKEVDEGVSLQLPLYAVALEHFLKTDTTCEEARLIQPGKRETREVLQRGKDKWPDREAAMRQGIARAVTGIRAGHFPPAPHNDRCRICALCRVCRYEEWRIERKSQTNDAAHD